MREIGRVASASVRETVRRPAVWLLAGGLVAIVLSIAVRPASELHTVDMILETSFAGEGDLARRAQVGGRAQLPTVVPEMAEVAGTAYGLIWVAMVAAVVLAGDWRRGLWPTYLSFQRRRSRLLAGRILGVLGVCIAAMAAAVVIGLFASWAFAAGAEVSFLGSPGWAGIRQILLAAFIVCVFVIVCAAIVTVTRSGLGLLVVLAGGVVAESYLIERHDWYRRIAPGQMIASLMQTGPGAGMGGWRGESAWWPVADATYRCDVRCIPDGGAHPIVAIGVLLGWTAVVAAVAWVAFARAEPR